MAYYVSNYAACDLFHIMLEFITDAYNNYHMIVCLMAYICSYVHTYVHRVR